MKTALLSVAPPPPRTSRSSVSLQLMVTSLSFLCDGTPSCKPLLQLHSLKRPSTTLKRTLVKNTRKTQTQHNHKSSQTKNNNNNRRTNIIWLEMIICTVWIKVALYGPLPALAHVPPLPPPARSELNVLNSLFSKWRLF